jgi:hypothetical protein
MAPIRLSILAILLLSTSAGAEIRDIVGPLTLESVRSAGKLTRSAAGAENLLFVPWVAARKTVRAAIDAVQPTLVVELLAWERFEQDGLETPEGRLRIHNTLRAVSRLEGLHYYSASRRRVHLLYRTSHRIAAPSVRDRMPDPVVNVAPAAQTFWVYQDDTTFGANVFEITYEDGPEYVLMRAANTTVMRSLLLPVVRSGGMVSQFIIVPWGNEVLFYAVAAARLVGPWASSLGAAQVSFTNRVSAMWDWFRAQIASPGPQG